MNNWLEFLSGKIRSQIALETVRKVQVWALGILAFTALGFALNAVGQDRSDTFLYATKILFLIFFQAVVLLGVYMPALLQKNQKTAARLFRLQDPTGFFFFGVLLALSGVSVWMLSAQAVKGSEGLNPSNLFSFSLWAQFASVGFYLAAGVFYLAGLLFYPAFLTKALEKTAKPGLYALAGLHSLLFFLLGFGYSEMTAVGSPEFFGQFRVAGLFWIFVVSALLWVGRFLEESTVPSLDMLQLEVVSGRLKDQETILSRIRESAVSRRFELWIQRKSLAVTHKALELAGYAQDAIALVSRDKPTEIDLRQVEDRYKKAESLLRRIDTESARFSLLIALLSLGELENQKAAFLQDLFSRESRNAKLELATVRKRIDEKLISIKNDRLALPSAPLQASPRELPLSR